jgi:hypothetical protein
MASGKTALQLLAWMAICIGIASSRLDGEPKMALIDQYWGKITSVRIDTCGTRPGLCTGMIILASRDGRSVALAVRPGT